MINIDNSRILIRIDENRVNENFIIYINIDDKTISRRFARCETINHFQFSSQRFRDSIEIFEFRFEKKFDQFFSFKENSKNSHSNKI